MNLQQWQNKTPRATLRPNLDTRRRLGHQTTRRLWARVDHHSKYPLEAQHSILTWKLWRCLSGPEGNLGKDNHLLFEGRHLTRRATLRGVLAALWKIYSTTPDSQNWPQIAGGLRPRRLPSYGHSGRNEFLSANPTQQSLYLNAHLIFYAFPNSSTTCRSIC